MLLAVLHRHAGLSCMHQDVFVNAVSGVRIAQPAADLAVLLAIQGRLRGKRLPLGFSAAVVPNANVPKKPSEGPRCMPSSTSRRRLRRCVA